MRRPEGKKPCKTDGKAGGLGGHRSPSGVKGQRPSGGVREGKAPLKPRNLEKLALKKHFSEECFYKKCNKKGRHENMISH